MCQRTSTQNQYISQNNRYKSIPIKAIEWISSLRTFYLPPNEIIECAKKQQGIKCSPRHLAFLISCKNRETSLLGSFPLILFYGYPYVGIIQIRYSRRSYLPLSPSTSSLINQMYYTTFFYGFQ